MRIKEAAVRHESIPIDQPVKTAFGTMTERHAVYLVVEDEAGHRGIGESWVNFPAWGPWERIAAFEHVINPWLEGREIENVGATVDALYAALRGPAVQSGTMGPLLGALCAVELALWDLAAQNAGLPLANLLWEAPRKKVRVYASGINSPLPWDLIDAHLDWGVTLFKLKLGFDDDLDRNNLEALHAHLDGRAALAIDVNRAWSLEKALSWIEVLADHDIAWLEEPLRVEDEPRMAELRAASRVPIAGAENWMLTPESDMTALAAGSIDVVQPDVTKYAPLHLVQQLGEALAGTPKRLVPHYLGSAPGGAASLHFAAGCPEGLLEWDLNRNPLRTAFFHEAFVIENGCIVLPDRPGLGWTYD